MDPIQLLWWVHLCQLLGISVWTLPYQEVRIDMSQLFGRAEAIEMINIQTHRAADCCHSIICIWCHNWFSALRHRIVILGVGERQGLIQDSCLGDCR